VISMQRLLSAVLLCGLGSLFANRASATPVTYAGTFASDDSTFVLPFSTTSSENFTFATTSFAAGGFVPVLTLFNASGGVPITFAETDTSDVSITQTLGPGDYLLYLTEDPNVFTTTLAAGPLFAGQPNVTGSFCGGGGPFLDVFDGCTQQTGNYSVTENATAVAATPEPASWLLLLPPVVIAFVMRRRLMLGNDLY
jgi:hypothetical protein